MNEQRSRSVSLKTGDKGVATGRAREFVEAKIESLVLKQDPVARTENLGVAAALREYTDDIRAKGRTEKQAKLVHRRIERVIEQAGITEYAQLDPVLATKTIRELWDQGVFTTATSANRYRECLRSWSTWMKRNKRWTVDVLEDMERLQGDSTNSRPRARLTREQLDHLLASTRSEPSRRNLFGIERSWLYALAAMTGLRASELASLTPKSFHLEGVRPYVEVSPTISKRRKHDQVDLQPAFAEALREWIRGLNPEATLFGRSESWTYKAASMLRDDLEAAGIPHKVQTDEGEKVIDFHSFRAFFISEAILTGEPLAVVKKTVRASSEAIVARYVKFGSADTSRCVNAMPLPDLKSLAP